MLGDMVPFRMAGNIYFVGTYAASSHAIDTGEGLILIDAGYTETAPVIVEGLNTLGFDVKDIKIILLSHGHRDHSDGAPELSRLSGAKIYMFREDNKYLDGFEPDVYLHDGDKISLGNTEILCLHTAGHTEGTASFFFDTVDNGRVLRAGMFGGAGTNQLKKKFLDVCELPYRLRGLFFETVERLRGEHVDIFIGNHSWHNKTREGYEQMQRGEENPFIDSTRWGKFLDKCEKQMWDIIEDECKTEFVNYAHRGASEYLPENTFLSFYTGVYMGANGIETDVRRTKDGHLVLFHDKTLERVTGAEGSVEESTLEELMALNVTKNDFFDKIVLFEDFLKKFSFRDLTFAIELKGEGVESEVADLIRKYGMQKKTVITSFNFEYIENIKKYAPELRVGWLIKEVTDETLPELLRIGADEICPRASFTTKEFVRQWHRLGFRVRAWGLDTDLMKTVYDNGADGMTVNFPDLLVEYMGRQ